MSEDLIKRSDAISEICKARTPDVVSHQYAEQFINAVCRAPSADRPSGKWIEINIKDYKAKCSHCGTWSPIMGSFCPYCGARMKRA